MPDAFRKKFVCGEEGLVKSFVQNGYVILTDIHNQALIENSRKFFFDCYDRLREAADKGEIPDDVNGWARAIIEKFEKTDEYDQFIRANKLVTLLKGFLGPDIAILGYDALWINVPEDEDPVLLKGLHTDAWTGTSINSIFVKTFFTDVDDYNGMVVCPGSHLQGLLPVRNRQIDPSSNVQFDEVNLNHIKAGDVLIWHPLLIHATTGHSEKNIRMSVTSRYTSTETEFSSQERSLGYKPICVGPMNQIKRLIGDDSLRPFRTYGGYVGVDRRLEALYGYSEYKRDSEYDDYIA